MCAVNFGIYESEMGLVTLSQKVNCLVDLVHLRKLHRSLGTYFPYIPQSVSTLTGSCKASIRQKLCFKDWSLRVIIGSYKQKLQPILTVPEVDNVREKSTTQKRL